MKHVLLIAATTLLCSCAAHAPRTVVYPSSGTVIVKAPKNKKCQIIKPEQPEPLKRPLPLEDPQKLIDLLTVKLDQWAGPGGYGDKIEKAIDICNRKR